MKHPYAKSIRKKLREMVGLAYERELSGAWETTCGEQAGQICYLGQNFREVCGRPEIYAQNIFLLN
jgi:hypothetical protein